MKLNVNIYSLRHGGIIATSSDMSDAEGWGLIGQAEIDIGDIKEYDWAAHDERKRNAEIAALKDRIAKLEAEE